jgi:cytochrome c-type biogenesis protein CcmH
MTKDGGRMLFTFVFRHPSFVSTFMKKLFLLLTLLLALVAVAPAYAQGTPPVTDDDVNRVAKGLYCPICENIPLDVCPTQACIQWRATIREKLELGWSEQTIRDYFAQQYGERVLAQPSTRGLNILIWVIPPIGIVLGALLLWYFLRQMRKPALATAQGEPVAPTSDAIAEEDELTRQLEDELRRRA